MHPINKALSRFNLVIGSTRVAKRFPAEFAAKYEQQLKRVKQNSGAFKVFQQPHDDAGEHPIHHTDFECSFAARQLGRVKPESILDIGSDRHFILGLLANFRVTTIDVRGREAISNNETVITGDAKALGLPDNSFDAVVTLCALEHFGLGRYGDDFDLHADKAAFDEMIRVLKPGGQLIFTTTITNAPPSIAFNAHRIYSHEMIESFCSSLACVEEAFYSTSLKRLCSLEHVTVKPADWDVYMGCWSKTGAID